MRAKEALEIGISLKQKGTSLKLFFGGWDVCVNMVTW